MKKDIRPATNAPRGSDFVLSAGLLDQKEAKTTHGLIRDSERFQVAAVIDERYAGKDAGDVLDGKAKGIPIFSDLESAIQALGKPDYTILGVATIGGVLPPNLLEDIRFSLRNGISVVNGLHDYLQDHEDLKAIAAESGAQLIDIRKPKRFSELHFWSEEIYDVNCPIVSVLGMDCAVGKRTTARFLTEACQEAGLKAEMIYTGQTGWMQGSKYGFIFDSTLNDFVSGELTHAIIQAFKNEKPDVLFLEGQSSLRNPSGPCGPEYLISANSKYVVLVHELKKQYFDDHESWGKLPSVSSEMDLIKMYNSEVIALALNTRGCTPDEAKKAKENYEKLLGIPVLLPLEEGVQEIASIVNKLNNV